MMMLSIDFADLTGVVGAVFPVGVGGGRLGIRRVRKSRLFPVAAGKIGSENNVLSRIPPENGKD